MNLISYHFAAGMVVTWEMVTLSSTTSLLRPMWCDASYKAIDINKFFRKIFIHVFIIFIHVIRNVIILSLWRSFVITPYNLRVQSFSLKLENYPNCWRPKLNFGRWHFKAKPLSLQILQFVFIVWYLNFLVCKTHTTTRNMNLSSYAGTEIETEMPHNVKVFLLLILQVWVLEAKFFSNRIVI